MRRVRWALAGVLLVAAHGLGPARADAGESAGVTLRITAGADGRVAPGRAYPVLVEVKADRLVTGSLRLTATGEMGNDVIQRPVEVAGGTTKRYALVVGTNSGFGGDSVRVDLLADGDRLATERVQIVSDAGEELVGVLPGLAATLDRETAPLAVDVGQARLSTLPPEVLDEGPIALEVYDQIAAGAGDLDDLSDAERRTMAQWVSQGGYLLLDGDADAASLPPGFDPAPGIARVVGFGKVVLTKGDLAAGRWQEALVPTPVQSQVEEEILGSGTFVAGDVTSSLAADAGFDVPSISNLLLVLAGYIVVVGPVAWFLVRRRRTTLLWVVVPAVALITTAVVRLAGDEVRDADPSVHVTMIETAGEQAMATTSVFVIGDGERQSVELANGWRPAVNAQQFGGFGFASSSTEPVTRLGDGSRIDLDGRLGSATVVRARGPVELDGGLVVTASSDEDGVMHGTVENTLDVDLEEVAVFVARVGVTEVGTVAAGATEEWTVDDATRFEFEANAESRVWPLDMDEGSGFVDEGVPFDPRTGEPLPVGGGGDVPSLASSLSAYSDVFSDRGASFKPQGQAVAVGWTRALDAPVRVGGQAVGEGRTGIIGRAQASSIGGRLVDVGATQHLVRGPASSGRFTDGDVDPNGNSVLGVYAFDLPGRVGERAVDAGRLTFHVPNLFRRIQVWADGRWVELPAGDGEVAVPEGAVLQQMIFARVEIPVDQVPGPGRAFVVYEADA